MAPRVTPRCIAVFAALGLIAAAPVALVQADEAPPAAAPSGAVRAGSALTTWAMRWFTEMMAGRTDRSQYSAAFAPQVTDDAVARHVARPQPLWRGAAAGRNRADQDETASRPSPW